MRCLLRSKKLIFVFTYDYIACHTVNHYQINGILSFAVLDLAYKIIKQHKRKSIILKKRKPIIHLLNYIDALNFNSREFDVYFFLKNWYNTRLANNLYLYRSKYFKDLNYKDKLRVTVRENLCTIRFDNYYDKVQEHNVNLVGMVIHILEKQKRDEINVGRRINVSGIMLYCTLLTG